MMKKIQKIITVAGLAIISVLFLMTYTIIAKDLPILVDVTELNQSYDGKRVVVFGWARSTKVMLGRMGSHYVQTKVGEEESTVAVFSAFPPYNVVNNRVIVQGIYHHQGRYGGNLVNHFINAEVVMRDWEGKVNQK